MWQVLVCAVTGRLTPTPPPALGATLARPTEPKAEDAGYGAGYQKASFRLNRPQTHEMLQIGRRVSSMAWKSISPETSSRSGVEGRVTL